MILIADSGSTKCRWCLMTANGQSSEFLTDGINPLFQTSDAMRNSISNQLLPQMAPLLWAGTLTHVFVYAALMLMQSLHCSHTASIRIFHLLVA